MSVSEHARELLARDHTDPCEWVQERRPADAELLEHIPGCGACMYWALVAARVMGVSR